MICLKLATRTGSFQVDVDATPPDCGVASINYERKPLAVPGTWNTGTNYADSRYQLPRIDSVRASMTEYTAGKVVIVVGQRVASMSGADQILVMEAGEIVARGTHDELMASSATYREIAQSQKAVQA